MKEKEVVRTGRSKTRHATFGFTGGKNGSFYSIGEKYQKLQTKLSREKNFFCIFLRLVFVAMHAKMVRGIGATMGRIDQRLCMGCLPWGRRHTNAAFHYLFLFLIFNFLAFIEERNGAGARAVLVW